MNRNPADSLIKHLDFIFIDLLSLQISFVLAHLVITHSITGTYTDYHQLFLLRLLMLCQMLTIVFHNNYEIILRRGPYEEMAKILRFSTMMGVMMLFLLFIFQLGEDVSRLQTGWTMVIYVLVDWILRYLNKRRIYRNNKNGREKPLSMIVATTGALVDRIMSRLDEQHITGDHHIAAIVLVDGDRDSVKREYDVPVLMPDRETIERIQKDWVDEVFCLQPDGVEMDNEVLNDFVDMGITVHICPLRLNDANMPLTEINSIGDYTVLTSRLRFVSLDQVIIKRLMDIAGGLVGCVLTLIIAIVIYPMIYVKSPGPLFFSQERIGRSGRKFRMYKFRSMYMDAEERRAALMEQNRVEGGMMFKIDDDPRIIGSEKKDAQGRPRGIGNIIRNTSIDEFPQFWNVLKGDMSLVGTRPPLPDEWEKYDPHHRARMTVKPGITGLWQISGRSDITDFEEVVRLDMEYIENWDVKYDIKILLKTVEVVFKESGASGR